LAVPKRELPSLGGEGWLNEPRLQHVLRVLNNGGVTRVAGGAVRNALLGVPVADIDLATTLLPDQVSKLAKAAGFGVHPTGIEHGTVTITHQGAAFEVTTLRLDVETDGRRAVVAFTEDWAEDAARRDFTINAMYCDADGKIYDFTEGYADVVKRRVRFVGKASARIKEDYLRILRFFRFQAFYGKGRPDEEGFKACVRLRAGLKTLSAERLRAEVFKLLVAPHAVKVLKVMAEAGVLKTILAHTEEWRVLCRLPADPVLRLFVLAKEPLTLKDRFRLSNADAARQDMLAAVPDLSPSLTAAERRRMLYHLGVDQWRDAVRLSWAQSRAMMDDVAWASLLELPEAWSLPRFPVSGSDLLKAGLEAGPRVGQVLSALEDWWMASDFVPTRDDLLARLGRYKT
jgi:poly(A) polymerase